MFFGKVVSVDETNKLVFIQFETVNGDSTDIEGYDWNSLDISWKTRRPINIVDAIGYNVTVPKFEFQGILKGKIVALNTDENRVFVKFDNENSLVDYDFDDRNIAWGSKSLPSNLKNKHSVSFQNIKPKSIEESVGYVVTVKSKDPNAQDGDMFPGKVTYCNERTNKVRIKFVGDDDVSLEDYEDYDWDSPDIYWISKEPPPPLVIPNNNRPKHIEETIRYAVEVKSTPDSFFTGKVISFSKSLGTVRILFDNEKDVRFDDFEDFNWKSPLVNWVTKSLLQVNKPSTINEAINRNVKVVLDQKELNVTHDGILSGFVKSFNEEMKTVSIQFNDHPTLNIDVLFDSNKIIWESERSFHSPLDKASVDTSQVKKPTLENSIGWLIQINDADGSLVGKIVGHKLIGKILQISFYDDEINDFDEQIEELPYNTPGLDWLEKTT